MHPVSSPFQHEMIVVVDDFALCMQDKSLNRVEKVMHLCVNSIEDLVYENGFKFSTSKTVCIHLHQPAV